MSRIVPTTIVAPIQVAASDNIYTVLTLASSVALMLGVLVLFLRATTLGVKLF